MPLLEDIATKVAARTLKLIETTGDENLETKVAQEIGASSPTLQEAFATAIRILTAEARADRYLSRIDGTAPAEPAPTPKAAPDPEPEPEPEVEEEPIILGSETEQIDEDEDEEELIALPGPSRVKVAR